MKKQFLLLLSFLLSAVMGFAVEIEPGVYRIVSQYTGNRVLFIENSSLDNSAKAVAWTETGTNSQRWRIVPDESGDYYYLTNLYSGQNLRMAGSAAKGVGVNQTAPSSALVQKWAIESAGTSAYYISSASLLSGQKLYLELANGDKLDSDGAALQLWTKDEENLPRRIWTLERVDDLPNQFTVALRTEMVQSWKNLYYKKATVGYDIGGGFWGCAENLEILLDAYEHTGYAEYKTMFEEAYRNFIYRNSSNWMGNEFNDDIAWICIASVRAYLMMGNSVSGINFLTNAKNNFDNMYKRALIKTNSYYLLRWKEGNGDGTGSCINGPAEVAACYLAMATGDNTYYEKAKMLYGNQRLHLYNPETGQVYDSTSDGGSTNYWASTYNQGTYLGAAVMLYNRYGDEMYKNDAQKIIQYTRDHLCNSHGVINVCDGGSDLPGFKGILMRYVRRYITDLRQPQWIDWMQLNALHAYNNRNSAGVTWTAWWEKSTENFKHGNDNYDSFGCGPAVSAAVNSPMDKNSITKNAFANIEAGSFNYLKGLTAENNTSGETAELTGMKNGDYLVYSNVDFRKNMPIRIELTVANDNQARTIEVRTDSLTGMKIAEISVPASNGAFTTVQGNVDAIDGMHNIWLIFKGEVNGLRLKNFRFVAGDALYPDITDNGGTLAFSHTTTSGNNLIDNRLSSLFQITCANDDAWIQYQSKIPVRLQAYALASSGESNASDPKTWKLQASTNGINWTDIDSRSEQTFTERFQLKRYELSEAAVYAYFRLQVTQRNGNSGSLALAEWQLFGSALFADDITADGGTLSGQFPGLQNNEVVETLEKLTDKSPTSKYVVKDQSDLWIQYKAAGKYRLTAYSLTSANDFA
ncbi:MAG: carbohydrate-binding protein, partial [Candidatus Symbiothrix sp.]|nr:carbohydrate-binding protein [Candidatus Symbiothrix sp.]